MKRQKSRDVRRHALKRAWDRFGLRERDVQVVVEMVQQGRSTLVEKQSNRISIHQVEFNGQRMHVAYDKVHKAPVTFLYPDQQDYPLAMVMQ